jgi:hypothetical protein
MPFTTLKRRKQQEGNQFVKWAMRAVLASPIAVLVLWSTCALLFSNKAAQQANPSRRAAKLLSKTTKHKTGRGNNNNNGIDNFPMALSVEEGTAMYSDNILPPVPLQKTNNMNGMDGNLYMMQPYVQADGTTVLVSVPVQTPQQQQVPQPLQQSSRRRYMRGYMASNSAVTGYDQLVPEPPPQIQVINGQQYMLIENNVMQDQMLPVYSPLGATSGSSSSNSDILFQPPPPPLTHVSGANAVSKTVVVRPRPAPRATPDVEILEPPPQQHLVERLSNGTLVHVRNTSKKQVMDAPPQQHLVERLSNGTLVHVRDMKKQQVYYYDAKEASSGTQDGEFDVPLVVYDEGGNAISLDALMDHHTGAEVFLEPPLQAVYAPAAWGESAFQDQSIIVSTVAVMALLVGALSARRLRSRSFLSSCIENESLEDDIAYDTAYTTTDNSYNTFGGWKGDLEKFDV